MKVKIAIITGLVMAGTSVLRAEESSGTAKGNYRPPAQPAVSFRSIIWANQLGLHEAERSFPTDGYTNATLPEIIMEYGDRIKSNEYQVIAVYRKDGRSEFIELDPETTAAAVTNGSLPDLRDASEFYSWKYGIGRAANSGYNRKNPTQIIIIEPWNPKMDFTTGKIRIQEYRFDTIQPETAWHEWISPRLFLLKCADYWVNGTNAAPIALIIITF